MNSNDGKYYLLTGIETKDGKRIAEFSENATFDMVFDKPGGGNL